MSDTAKINALTVEAGAKLSDGKPVDSKELAVAAMLTKNAIEEAILAGQKIAKAMTPKEAAKSEEPGEKESVAQATEVETKITNKYGQVHILGAELIAKDLPKSEGEVATAAEIDGLNSTTALNKGKPMQVNMGQALV